MSDTLILFVHGLGGDASDTWGRFGELITADPRLQNCDVAFWEYPTSLFRLPLVGRKLPGVQTLADALKTSIDHEYPDRECIVLVAHSLGGLVCRQYLINEVLDERDSRVKKLILYAVPNDGNGLASAASHIPWRHNQLRQLARQSDLVDNLNRTWDRLGMGDRFDIWAVVATLDRVVDEPSARHVTGTTRVDTLLDRGHRDCVKPVSADDLTYKIVRDFVRAPVAATSGSRPLGVDGFHVVAFDLDGTLVRGLTFSWTLVWDYLGYERDVSREGMRRYLRGHMSYEEWCDWAVGMYRARGLRREDFSSMTDGLTLTKNLREAVMFLRQQGFVTGIISGGINALLEEMIPDADDLFDHIFINRLRFDAAGVVEGVEATPYDFETKLDGLRDMCELHGFSISQGIFVGEGFNDAHVSRAAGLSIAFPPHHYSLEAASHIQIEEDDLMKVVEAILSA